MSAPFTGTQAQFDGALPDQDQTARAVALLQAQVLALQSGAIPGRTSGVAVPAGFIGEVISGTLAAGSAVSLTTGTPATIITLPVTPGVWMVSGGVIYHSASGTTVPADVKQGISATAATIGAQRIG